MPSQSRKHRGYKSQDLVAQWLTLHGFPYAESTGAGRQGADVTGTPGLALEVKARAGFEPLAWLRQAKTHVTDTDLHAVVFRCNGQGEANIGSWGCLLDLATFGRLLTEAGYGDHGPALMLDELGPQYEQTASDQFESQEEPAMIDTTPSTEDERSMPNPAAGKPGVSEAMRQGKKGRVLRPGYGRWIIKGNYVLVKDASPAELPQESEPRKVGRALHAAGWKVLKFVQQDGAAHFGILAERTATSSPHRTYRVMVWATVDGLIEARYTIEGVAKSSTGIRTSNFYPVITKLAA